MVDIAMCKRRDCSKRLTCFRYLAEADEYRQSYINGDYHCNVDDGCKEYWLVRNGKELKYYNKNNKEEQ